MYYGKIVLCKKIFWMRLTDLTALVSRDITDVIIITFVVICNLVTHVFFIYKYNVKICL